MKRIGRWHFGHFQGYGWGTAKLVVNYIKAFPAGPCGPAWGAQGWIAPASLAGLLDMAALILLDRWNGFAFKDYSW